MADTMQKIGFASNFLLEADPLAASAGQDGLLMVTFTIGNQTFGRDILHIQEVISINRITRVPHVKDYIKGVTNLRGNMVPTLDLRARLRVRGS
ncbi:chemotaxis protein CheW [Candidatus Neomarinimicrobiota bacterium]